MKENYKGNGIKNIILLYKLETIKYEYNLKLNH